MKQAQVKLHTKIAPLLVSCPPEGKVLDVGCLGFRVVSQAKALKRSDLRQFGVDYSPGNEFPDNFTFANCNLNEEAIPFDDDFFDLVIASHVIEHVFDPLKLMSELIRVTKPGGRIYIEAPSERSLLMPGMPFGFDDCHSLSFFDDPTHTSRPWPPQALHRLVRCFGCRPLEASYLTTAWLRLIAPVKIILGLILRRGIWLQVVVWQLIGWVSFVVIAKPLELKGSPNFTYVSGRTPT